MTRRGVLCTPSAPPSKESPGSHRANAAAAVGRVLQDSRSQQEWGFHPAVWGPRASVPHSPSKEPLSHFLPQKSSQASKQHMFKHNFSMDSGALLELWHTSSGCPTRFATKVSAPHQAGEWCRHWRRGQRVQSIPPCPVPAGTLLTQIHK